MKIFFKECSLVVLLLLIFSSCKQTEVIELSSPNATKKIRFLEGENKNNLTFSVYYNDKVVVDASVLELLSVDLDFSGKVSVVKIENTSENTTWNSRFNELSTIPDHYNQTKIYLKQSEAKVNIIVRAYEEGGAFAYEIAEQQDWEEIGLSENVHYNFSGDYP
ncbi:MAG: glycoside hydrolase family 97 N-terminal domain-containing protein, partial [Arenibacter algicola]|nr:glycoside hydrolase family 97 N-terminal domain-containing protein [Arenibacter algicola]